MKIKTAPMGWNSWDCYGAAVDEPTVRQNAAYMAEHLQVFGWEYVVVDIQWYQPTATSHAYEPFAELTMDEYGRLQPAPGRFPSSAGGKGFKPLADYVHSLGLKCAVASNKPDAFSKQIVSAFFDESCFELVRGKLDGMKAKPAPDIVNDIMQKLDVVPEETVMVGDSDVDIITAENAGMRSIGCVWGFRGREELERAGAVYIAESPADIEKICREI